MFQETQKGENIPIKESSVIYGVNFYFKDKGRRGSHVVKQGGKLQGLIFQHVGPHYKVRFSIYNNSPEVSIP